MKRFIWTLVAVVFAGGVSAQQFADALRFSQTDYSLTTARAAAMGGAYSSLGADLSAAGINPAGLAMYRSSELSFSPSMMFSRQESNYTNGDNARSSFDNRNRLLFNNFGVATTSLYSCMGLKSSTFAVTLNRTIDHNSRMRVNGYSPFSLSEVLALDLNGIKTADISGGGSGEIYKAFYNNGMSLWPAILGYQSYFVNPSETADGEYYGAIENSVNQSLTELSKGATLDGNFSLALNFNNELYFGLTVGLVSIDYRNRLTYTENNISGSESEVTSMSLSEYLNIEGSGVNFKVGAIYRPIPEWRLGISYHSPSFINMEESYMMRMQTTFNNGDWCDNDTPVSVNEYDLQTPSRLLLGTSFTIDKTVILSADYERVWYNKISMDHPIYDLKNDIFNEINALGVRATNNYRFGGEAVLTRNVFLRMGYALYESMFSSDSDDFRKENISLGMGFRNRDFSLDVAYIYSETKSSVYMYKTQSVLGQASNKLMKNFLTVSLGCRF